MIWHSEQDSSADISTPAASRGTSLFRSQEPMGFASPARLRFDASLEGKADDAEVMHDSTWTSVLDAGFTLWGLSGFSC
jgi:hypothetical protein